jgi:fumarate hydratase subunit beta
LYKHLRNLKAGDRVFISGTVYAMRDEAHKRFSYMMIKNEKLPFDPKGQVIYYVGPTPAPKGKAIGSAGPTSSYRMDPFTPALLELGLKATIGKGPRDQAVLDSMKKHKAVYLAATGGAAVIISRSIKSAEVIAFEELGHEAVRKLEVENFPCIVAFDVFGNDIFKQGVEEWKK